MLKKKIKEALTLVANLKAAWLKARTEKKAAAEIEAARKAYQEKLALVELAQADGKKDDDEMEWPDDAAPNAAGANNGQPGNVVSLDELKTAISDSVRTQLAAALPDALKGQVTEEGLKKIIEGVLAKHSPDGKMVPVNSLKSIIDDAIKEQTDQIRKDPKFKFNADDANNGNKVVIELPCSWSKGNLPVHAKQLLNVMMMRPINHGISEEAVKHAVELGDRMVQKYKSMARRGEKALTSTGSGTGDEFVPTDLSAELQRRLYLSSDLAALFAAREVDMPSQPYEYPLSTTRPTFYLETTENTAATASDPGTAKITLDAKKLMGRIDFSYELEEDSIVPVLPFVQQELGEAAADAYESAIINGDTTATHQDTDTEAIPKAAERAYAGLRKLALAITQLKLDLSTGGLSEANLRAMRKAMRKFGVRPRDLVWIVGPAGINDVMAIANVSTLEKYGPKATILTGEIAAFMGIPIITSERCREDLNASGVNDGVTTTKGSILLFRQDYFLTGRRRDFTVESFRDIKSQQFNIVASFRRAFKAKETPSATIRSVVVGYNYSA